MHSQKSFQTTTEVLVHILIAKIKRLNKTKQNKTVLLAKMIKTILNYTQSRCIIYACKTKKNLNNCFLLREYLQTFFNSYKMSGGFQGNGSQYEKKYGMNCYLETGLLM